jgi:hypothetical protein
MYGNGCLGLSIIESRDGWAEVRREREERGERK